MAYLGDPRETRIQENGSILDGCGHKDDYYKWNGAYYHYCGLSVDDYSTNIYHTKSVDGSTTMVLKGWNIITLAEASSSGISEMCEYTTDSSVIFTIPESSENDTFVFNIPEVCKFSVLIQGQPELEENIKYKGSVNVSGVTYKQYYIDRTMPKGAEITISFNML